MALGFNRARAAVANVLVITLHLLAEGTDIHLRLPENANPQETLALCAEAMRGRRVIEFADAVPPGSVSRTTVVVNFEHVSGAWVDSTT